MMWLAASIPFWLLGGLLTIGGIVAPTDRRPGETAGDLVAQCLFGLVGGGLVLMFAAWVAGA